MERGTQENEAEWKIYTGRMNPNQAATMGLRPSPQPHNEREEDAEEDGSCSGLGLTLTWVFIG